MLSLFEIGSSLLHLNPFMDYSDLIQSFYPYFSLFQSAEILDRKVCFKVAIVMAITLMDFGMVVTRYCFKVVITENLAK